MDWSNSCAPSNFCGAVGCQHFTPAKGARYNVRMLKRVTKNNGEDLVTKDYFHEVISAEFEKFAGMIQRSFMDLQERMVTKTEFNEFKSEMYSFKDDTERSFYDLKTDVIDLKDKVGRVEKRLDSIEPKVESFVYMWREHEDRLGEHENRLALLEVVPA